MPCDVILHTEPRFVELVFTGSVSHSEMEPAAIQALEGCDRMQTSRLMCDCTQLSGGHSVSDLYELAGRLSASPLAATVREAVLLPSLPAMQADAQFWRATASNRGAQVQVFADRQAAMDWLLLQA